MGSFLGITMTQKPVNANFSFMVDVEVTKTSSNQKKSARQRATVPPVLQIVFRLPNLDHVMGSFLEHSMTSTPVHAKISIMVDVGITRTILNQYESAGRSAAARVLPV
ncbi:hypothetical protein HOLleu_15850 [Holothuria leucospilota]|uniref:Uncharacterized protein n=1 Tax=Holothuria leucospilota TaxID=206669 RepID=A0A9Q1C5A8_HOLLE|nr:hypothetical protein HOLleu_15850 [Holothuria leucospilota]